MTFEGGEIAAPRRSATESPLQPVSPAAAVSKENRIKAERRTIMVIVLAPPRLRCKRLRVFYGLTQPAVRALAEHRLGRGIGLQFPEGKLDSGKVMFQDHGVHVDFVIVP